MVRTIWSYSILLLATAFFGIIVIVASMLRIRGRIYFWATQQWSIVLLRASSSSVRVHGMERIDWSRPHVLVCNHVGSFDILALASSVPVPYHFVAKKELARIPLFGSAWQAAGHISIDRQNTTRAIESLSRAAAQLQQNSGIVIIFPEGTRSRTGELQSFKKGAFRLALEAGIPVIPTVIIGSDRITPGGGLMIRPGTIDLYIGDPISPGELPGEKLDTLIEATRRSMLEMLDSEGATPAAHPR